MAVGIGVIHRADGGADAKEDPVAKLRRGVGKRRRRDRNARTVGCGFDRAERKIGRQQLLLKARQRLFRQADRQQQRVGGEKGAESDALGDAVNGSGSRVDAPSLFRADSFKVGRCHDDSSVT